LATLNSNVIERGIREVQTGLELARTIYKKRKGLWEQKIGSEIQYLQAKNNKESLENKLKTLEAQLEMSKIKAPISGIVDEIAKKEGELAMPGLLLIRVVNLKKVYVNADLSEAYLPKIQNNDSIEVSFPSFPDLTFKTKIQRIGSVVNPENRTFKITILIDNDQEKLKPNMLAIVKMMDFSSESALVVPSIIIKKDINGSYVYRTEKKADKLIASKIYVEPGISEKTNTMINKGLEPGYQVITKGYNLVRNGVEVRINK